MVENAKKTVEISTRMGPGGSTPETIKLLDGSCRQKLNAMGAALHEKASFIETPDHDSASVHLSGPYLGAHSIAGLGTAFSDVERPAIERPAAMDGARAGVFSDLGKCRIHADDRRQTLVEDAKASVKDDSHGVHRGHTVGGRSMEGAHGTGLVVLNLPGGHGGQKKSSRSTKLWL